MQMLGPMLAGSATIGGGAAATAGAGISFAKILSIGAGVASGLASLAKGGAEAASLRSSAEFEDFNSRQELLRGRAEGLEVIRAANDAVAAATVAGFASGLAGSGSIAQAKMDAMEEGEFQVGLTRANAEISAGARRGKAKQLRLDARSTRIGSIFEAAGTGMNVFSRLKTTG